MMDNIFFTILLVTYNSSWEKTKVTLDSIINQKFDGYELVISDDGSRNNLFPQIENYLKEKNFLNYTLVENKINQGTVKNLLSGLKFVKGKYVKDIGSGDLLYDQNTISNMYHFMVNENVDHCFGLMKGYSADRRDKLFTYYSPYDVYAYLQGDTKRICKNQIVFSDIICGASMFYSRDFLIESLNRIVNKIIYAEDLVQFLYTLENNPYAYLDKYVVIYETDTGISKTGKFQKLLDDDLSTMDKILLEKYNVNYVRRRLKVAKNRKVKNKWLRICYNVFTNLDSILFALRHYFAIITKKYEGKN